ncbi:MAG: hypothetical protein ACJAT2_001288 [Bacteriovoracaceae bacterium]|jgi:hypothetical protein
MKLFSFALLFTLLASQSVFGEDDVAIFSGRASRINFKADLLRIKIDFGNVKYLNVKDKVEFWDERDSSKRCKAYLVGKSNDYLLFKVPSINFCKTKVFLSVGAYLKFYSIDLFNNIKMGKSLIDILLKKRLALSGKLRREQKSLDSFIEKVNSVNARYQILRDKLEAEWRDQIASLEEDKTTSLRNYKDLEIRLEGLDKKLQRYSIEDKNLKLDRWALDPRLYFKK